MTKKDSVIIIQFLLQNLPWFSLSYYLLPKKILVTKKIINYTIKCNFNRNNH